jgi:hypothetical protein
MIRGRGWCWSRRKANQKLGNRATLSKKKSDRLGRRPLQNL